MHCTKAVSPYMLNCKVLDGSIASLVEREALCARELTFDNRHDGHGDTQVPGDANVQNSQSEADALASF